MNFIIPLVFTIIAIVIFAVSLHFSRYKKRKTESCCSGNHLVADKNSNTKTCCKDAEKSCIC